jgi:hypothetical protein
MILSSEKIMNSRSKIFCFRYNSRHYQWKKKMQTYGGMHFKTLFKRILGGFAKSMRGVKGCTDTRFLKWK